MENVLSKLPSVNFLLDQLDLLQFKIDRSFIKILLENTLAEVRNNPGKFHLSGSSRDEISTRILELVENKVNRILQPSLQRVINGTGVILHTGLGRAPLGSDLIQVIQNLGGFTNLEINLSDGKRGERLDHIIPLLQLLTGAEDAIVVNNNAAAVLLMLNSIARKKEVIVSRGELVEIGGSFRLPEVMKSSGAKMVEVGVTNKTHLSDYENAITKKTAAILLVHPSNYQIVGFTAKPELQEIIELAHSRDVPVLFDLGSGALIDMRQFGYTYEPVVSEMLQLGFDLVSFSGDKLLGGPQSGIVVGKKELIFRLRKNHLLRALRCDKITLALLSAVLQKYLYSPTLVEKNQTLNLFKRTPGQMKKIAQQIVNSLLSGNSLSVQIVNAQGRIGSGAYPVLSLKSLAIQVQSEKISAEKIARQMRLHEPPVFGHIENDIFYLNLLAVFEKDIPDIIHAFNGLR